MKKNYDFHLDLRTFEKMKPPVIPAIIPGLQKLMGILYRLEKSDEKVSISKFHVPAKDDAKIRVLIYEPKASVQNPPCMLFFHGGGFVYNSSPHHHRIPMPRAQMLLYPVTDRRMKTESMRKYTDTPICKRGDMEKYFRMYLPTDDLTPDMIPYVSPIEAESLKGIPDTYIEVAEFDCLHDEGVELAHRLKDEGVSVELHETSGTMHGYDIAVNCSLMREYMASRLRFLKNVNLV